MFSRRAFLGTSALALAAPRLAWAQADPYVLGALFSMSGPSAEFGRIYMQGTQLALEHLAADKWLKRPVVLRVEDSQGLPQAGAVGITKLINVDGTIYVLIGFTGVSKAAAPIAQRSKVILINGGAVGPDLAGLTPYFWSVIPLANIEVRSLFPWITQKKLKRVAIVYTDDSGGATAVMKELQAGLPSAGAEVVGTFSVPLQAQQFTAVAASVRQTNPDAVYVSSYGAQQGQIIKQFRDNGVSQQLLSFSAVNIEPIWKLPEAEGLVFTSQATAWDAPDEVTQRFVKDFRAKFGSDPVTYSQNYYNGVRLFGLLARGLEQAGTPVNGDTMRAELMRVRTFPLVGGKGTFDDTGTLSMPIQINQITGGKVVKVGGA